MSAALAIANSRGVPGTAAALVEDAAGRRLLLANHHVVFGGGAGAGQRIWALRDTDSPLSADQAVPLGRALRGRLGPSGSSFVDCALIELDDALPDWLNQAVDACVRPIAATATAPGAAVHKHGAATGLTEGILVDLEHAGRPHIEGEDWNAARQLLVGALDPDLNFSAAGDSGAALLDEDGGVLGLLWGSNSSGQGIACPIGPVLDGLQVTLTRRRG